MWGKLPQGHFCEGQKVSRGLCAISFLNSISLIVDYCKIHRKL
jgi:hypothetical protein